jgi:hypothetical protein
MDQSQQIAAEHHDLAAHAHSAGAEHHGKEVHLTGHESSRLANEHSNKTYVQPQNEHRNTKHQDGVTGEAEDHDALRLAAYRSWQARGCPEGSPEEDWFPAVEAHRSHQTKKAKPQTREARV